MKKYLIFLLFSYELCAKTVLFIGDSLTAGYQIPKEKAYPSLIQNDFPKIKVINGSISGSTTASAYSRFKWFLKSKPDILFLALGANDGLRGIDLDKSKENLKKVISLAKENKLKIILAGMLLPPNYGEEYRTKFQKMFEDLAKEESLIFIPFLLKDVAAVKELNLSDGIHPNEKGHELIKKHVLNYLEPLL